MTTTRKILIALAILGAGLIAAIVFINAQPATFTVQRSATIAAPPSALFAQVDDLAAWNAWSPWRDLDPNPKTTISNPSSGKGATFSWSGNDAIGEGTLTILESLPGERIVIEQAFVRPMEGKDRMIFTFAPEGPGTRVTWRMEGTNGFVGKAICLFMDLDAKLGVDFERGLANMKTLVEKEGSR